jgi:drug/metabolite transporter (DMT)-like permease
MIALRRALRSRGPRPAGGSDPAAPAVRRGIGIALGHVFYYASLARLGVAVTASVLQLQPFLVAVGSAMLFGERLVAAQWTGGGIAVAGAVLILTAQQRLAARREKGRPSEESRP